MNKRSACSMWLAGVLLFVMLFPAAAWAGKGVDRSKIKSRQPIYPAVLTIGEMSFGGQVSRMDKITDDEIEKAIKKVLDEMDLTELEVGEAQALVDKVAADEEITKEEVDELMDNLLGLAGVNSIAELLEAMFGDSSKSFTDAMADYAADEIKGKAMDWMLNQLADGASDVFAKAKLLFDAAVLSMDQYEKDKQKWKNRADAANAQRMLNKFYDRINELLDNAASVRSRGWALQIEDSDSRYFTFYGVEGNLETFSVFLLLKKPDAGDDVLASGLYSGVVSIVVEYEMSKYDEGFKDWCVNKSGFLETYINSLKMAGKVTMDTSDEYSKTEIHRNLDSESYSTGITVPISPGSIKMAMDFSGFQDVKEISIGHKVTVKATLSGKVKMNHTYVVDYKAENEEKLSVQTKSDVTVSGGGQSVSNSTTDKQTVKWDSSVWEQWNKDKWLEITYP